MHKQISYSYSSSVYDEGSLFSLDYIKFRDNLEHDCYSFGAKFTVNDNIINIIEIVRAQIESKYKRTKVFFYQPYFARVDALDPTTKQTMAMVTIYVRTSDQDSVSNPHHTQNLNVDIQINGIMPLVEDLNKLINENMNSVSLAKITWHYNAGGRGVFKPVFLEKPRDGFDAFYPYIKEGRDSYYKRYLNSDSNILVMLGPPGTGKTSFIRDMIYKNKLNTYITYDEDMLRSDSFFVNFLTEESAELLVVEDADLLLTSRESDGNKVMNKLLNVSDGLIKIVSKKIIFTANIQQVSKIDSALTRPGRCFDLIEFRALNYEEACAAADAAGRPRPEEKSSSNAEYTLAEILAETGGLYNHSTPRRAGFLG